MGFRFRKSIKILPGVRLNISKKGVSSVSVGAKGLTVNKSAKGTRVTAGISGTGLSYSQLLSTKRARQSSNESNPLPIVQPTASSGLFKGVVIGVLFMLFFWWVF